MRWKLFRRAATWLVPLCLLAQLCSAGHMLLVEHVRCAEHGQLVHADDGHAEAHAGAAQPTYAAASIAEAPAAHDEHDHCSMWSEQRKLWLLPPSAPSVQQPAFAEELTSHLHGVSDASERLYQLAPKTSPPV